MDDLVGQIHSSFVDKTIIAQTTSCKLRKVFDCVDSKTLNSHYKIKILQPLLKFFELYSYQPQANGKCSEEACVGLGVSQGSVLGSLLFRLI